MSTADLTRLAPDGDGLAFFARHVRRDDLNGDPEWCWEKGFAPAGFLNVYLWRCLHCGEPLMTCDFD